MGTETSGYDQMKERALEGPPGPCNYGVRPGDFILRKPLEETLKQQNVQTDAFGVSSWQPCEKQVAGWGYK